MHEVVRSQPSARDRSRAAYTAATVVLGACAFFLPISPANAETPAVSLPGTFNSEIGCSGDWQPDCSQAQMSPRADGRWTASQNLPGGTWAYKIAIDNSWSESYGVNGAPGGANISLSVPAGGSVITFVYDPSTHLVTTTTGDAQQIVTAVGDYQSELGCGSDWSPSCTTTTMADTDGDGIYTYTTTAIPAGAWFTKVTIGQSWAENYGQNGTPGGANIGFAVASSGGTTTFSYDSASHLMTVQSTGEGGTTPDTLGAIYAPGATTFRIWSPDTSSVSVTVGGNTYQLGSTTISGYSGVYQAVVTGDLKGKSYQFRVGGVAVRDPYAQMVDPGTTQGVVVDTAAVLPTGGSWAARPALAGREDTSVYELSVRDFTIDASSGVDPAKRGKFMGLVQTGTTHNGVSTGIDHLKELGITAVQIMPAFDFGSAVPNWGYDPVNYNVPEEQYSQYSLPNDRIREFKDMVNEFHKNGIRVIMDVVYNHTYSKSVFGGITGKYYTPTDLSGTGNSIDDGDPMVSRMIRDSLEHWVRDYNVDGFRFDLVGVHHYNNVVNWANYLNTAYSDRRLLMYGEAWNGGAFDSQEAQKVRYGTVPALGAVHFGAFNGVYRDAIRGGTDNNVMAYMGGAGNPGAIAFGMRGSPTDSKSTTPLANLWSPAFAYDPEQTVNYASIHDNLNLYDKITYSGGSGGATGMAGRIDRFAVGMVLTSQGIPVISEGDEFLRSKVVNGDYNTAKNSYNASDTVNAIHWGDKIANAGIVRYYTDAIALRKSTSALRLTNWDAIHNQMSVHVDGSVVIGRLSSNAGAPTSYDTVVVYNPTAGTYNVSLPAGTWTKVLDTNGALTDGGTACDSLAVTVFKRN